MIIGCARSGTTLLQVMLDSHPDVAMAYYTQFLVDLLADADHYEVAGRLDAARLAADLIARRPPSWPFSPEYFAKRWDAGPPESLGAAIRQLLEDHARRHGKSRYGIKENRLTYHARRLSDLLPEARFLHVIRDGRDVALSYLSVDWGPTTWREAAETWKERVETTRRAGRVLGSVRYREVRYERLVEDPRSTVLEICDYLGLPFHEAMLSYYLRQDELYLSLTEESIHRNIRKAPVPLRDWHTDMPRSAVGEFEQVAGSLLEELGYPRRGCSTRDHP